MNGLEELWYSNPSFIDSGIKDGLVVISEGIDAKLEAAVKALMRIHENPEDLTRTVLHIKLFIEEYLSDRFIVGDMDKEVADEKILAFIIDMTHKIDFERIEIFVSKPNLIAKAYMDVTFKHFYIDLLINYDLALVLDIQPMLWEFTNEYYNTLLINDGKNLNRDFKNDSKGLTKANYNKIITLNNPDIVLKNPDQVILSLYYRKEMMIDGREFTITPGSMTKTKEIIYYIEFDDDRVYIKPRYNAANAEVPEGFFDEF